MAVNTAGDPAQQGPTLFGHPTGLFVLFFAEMWERFSYYGMRALLLYYMIKGFLGYSDDEAYAVYGAYGALVYATPFIGGMLADRLLGARRAVIFGGMLMAAGHLLMTIENSATFFVALALLVVGNGFFKPNISTIVGSLYPEGSSKRDAGFTLFYMGINLGAAMSPLLCGYIGETYGWHYGFGVATVGMLVGLAVFVAPVRITQGLILVGALGTATAMVMLPDNPYLLAINALVAAALVVAAVLSFVALGRGGLPDEVGLAPDPSALKRPVLAGISAESLVYFGTLAAVPVIALLVGRNEIAGWVLLIFGGLAFLSILVEAARSARVERERLFVVLILMFFSMLFWAFFEQAGSSVNNFTDRNVDRVFETAQVEPADIGTQRAITLTQEQLGHTQAGEVFTLTALDNAREGDAVDVTWDIDADDVGMGIADPGSEIPGSTFQSANPIFILTFGLVFSVMWTWLGARGVEPSTPVKFGFGLMQLGLGFGVLWYGAATADAQGMVWVGWLLLGYLLHTTGELCLSPVGLSMVTKLSPKRMVSTVMGAWFLATAFSNYLAGLLAGLTGVSAGEGGEKVVPPPIETVGVYGELFQGIAIAAVASGVVLLAISPLLRRWMHEEVAADTSGAEAPGTAAPDTAVPNAGRAPEAHEGVTVVVEPLPGAEVVDWRALAASVLVSTDDFLQLYPTEGRPTPQLSFGANSIHFTFPVGPDQLRDSARFRAALVGSRAEIDTAMSEAGVGWASARLTMATAIAPAAEVDDGALDMLRPAPTFEAAMTGGLTDADVQVRRSACWYISHMAHPSSATLRAVLQAGADDSPEVRQAVRRAAQALAASPDLLEVVRSERSHAEPRVRAAALGAVDSLLGAERLDADEALVWLIEGALDVAPVPEVAAELLGRLPRAVERRDQIVPALLHVLDQHETLGDEAAHGALLALINLHMSDRTVSLEVHQAIVNLAERPSAHQGLAKWALDLFEAR